MSERTLVGVAWSLCGASLLLATLAVLLEFLNRSAITLNEDTTISAPEVIMAVTFSVMGALVASRRTRNAIGWILCAAGSFSALNVFANAYATYSLLARTDALPGGAAVAWFIPWTWMIGIGLTPLLFLLFPTGRVLSGRWRPGVWLAVGALVIGAFILATAPYEETMPTLSGLLQENPLGIRLSSGLRRAVFVAFFPCLFGALIVSVASVFVRYRRALGEERAQLKWFGYGAAVLVASTLVNQYVTNAFDFPDGVLDSLGFAAVAAGLGVAILRYRLYDIDVIINRTLVYGALTAVLALVYVLGVIGLGGAVRSVTGQQSNSLAVAASTLAVAAMFRPARTRIQAFIDHRFYRSKYDAAKTLETFSGRLRDEIELDGLTTDLLAVVTDTMQPAHASLWLKAPAGGEHRE